MPKLITDGTIKLDSSPSIYTFAAVGGKAEGDGPLGKEFDMICEDNCGGEDSWEKSENKLQQLALEKAFEKQKLAPKDIELIFAGDLLNQCTGSGYALRDMKIPFLGVYGACSTMAESLLLASLMVDGQITNNAAAVTSSHFCSAERQFRFPLNYGSVRTPSAQWTATASGALLVTNHDKPPYVKSVTVGKITDMGIKDANNMGAAMAGAAYDTISRHLKNLNQTPDDYDIILTGDLGKVGRDLLLDLFNRDGVDLSAKHNDCGLLIYDFDKQDVHSGGSGCGCGASVLCGHFLKRVQSGEIKNLLFAATGALLSPTMVQQGESIPGISHAVHISFY